MKTFDDFLYESKTFDHMEKYYAKTPGLVFVEDSVKKTGYNGSQIGNNNDKYYVADLALKSAPARYIDIFSLDPSEEMELGKNVYRYETKTTQAGKMRPLIKIDLNKGMVYYMQDSESEEIKFETRGEKIQFLVVYKKDQFLKNQK